MASGSLSGSWLEGRNFSFKGIFSRGGTGSWLLAPLVLAWLTMRMRKTGVLGGRATHTANKKIHQQKNTADEGDGKPCPTAPLPSGEEESGAI